MENRLEYCLIEMELTHGGHQGVHRGSCYQSHCSSVGPIMSIFIGPVIVQSRVPFYFPVLNLSLVTFMYPIIGTILSQVCSLIHFFPILSFWGVGGDGIYILGGRGHI